MLLLNTLTVAFLAAPPAGAYTLDAEETLLLVQLRPDKSRLLSGLSHDHVIRAKGPEGRVTFDPAHPNRCQISVTALVANLQVDAPDMRKKVGYKDVLDEGDRDDIRENMLDEDQLDGKRHKTISFSADRCEVMPTGRIQVDGKLTVRGKTHAMKLPMDVAFEKGVLRAYATFTLTHGVFGFEPYSAALGALANDDWLKFTVDIVARSKAGLPAPSPHE
ncbi:MAG: YceI family protein [Myxococcota bacterium]